MPQSLPKITRNSRTNGCAGAFLIVVGLGLMGVPLQDGVPLGLFHDFYQTASFLVFELVGLGFFAWGIWFLVLGKAFDPPRIEMPAEVGQGDAFQYRYRQRARRRVAVRAIDLFLVYREEAAWGGPDNSSRYVFDRLIAKQSFASGSYARGDEISVEATFRVPMGEMGLRNPYMHIRGVSVNSGWVVRARVRFGRASEIWEDRDVAVPPTEDEKAVPVQTSAQPVLYDVLLLPSPLERTGSIIDALGEVAPELGGSGVPYAQNSSPNVIRERLSESEAEAIADPLRRAGAIVNVVPSEATWWLPATGSEQQEQATQSTNFRN